MADSGPGRILIVKLSAIGDCLMATPVARALRQAFPESHIAWVVERKSADVVLGNSCLDEVIVWERTGGGLARSVSRLRAELGSRRFDVCVDLQGLLRSAGVCLVSGAKRRIGFADGDEYSHLFYHDKYDPGKEWINAQQRNLDLLRVLGVESSDTAMCMPLGDDDRGFADAFLRDNGLTGSRLVAFCPATTFASKHWTEEGWTRLADLLGEKHGAIPLIMGSGADIALAERVARDASVKPVIVAGRTTLKQAGAIVEKCAAMVAVDTGLLYMGAALRVPAVGIFGATALNARMDGERFELVENWLPCSPCLRRPVCKDFDCMRGITPERVEAAARRWLG